MYSEKVSLLIQFMTILSVMVGLGLVIYELRQTQMLSRAQIASDNHAIGIQANIAELGEEPYVVIRKVCSNESLSPDERVIFNSLMWVRLQLALRMFQIERIANFDRRSYDYGVYAHLTSIFESKQGRIWWESILQKIPKDFAAFAQDYYSSFSDSSICLGRQHLINKDRINN